MQNKRLPMRNEQSLTLHRWRAEVSGETYPWENVPMTFFFQGRGSKGYLGEGGQWHIFSNFTMLILEIWFFKGKWVRTWVYLHNKDFQRRPFCVHTFLNWFVSAQTYSSFPCSVLVLVACIQNKMYNLLFIAFLLLTTDLDRKKPVQAMFTFFFLKWTKWPHIPLVKLILKLYF